MGLFLFNLCQQTLYLICFMERFDQDSIDLKPRMKKCVKKKTSTRGYGLADKQRAFNLL